MRIHPSLLHHRLQSLVRACGHRFALAHNGHSVQAGSRETEFVWMTFAERNRPRALGIRLRANHGSTLSYEVAERHRSGKLRLTRWRFDAEQGWQQLGR